MVWFIEARRVWHVLSSLTFPFLPSSVSPCSYCCCFPFFSLLPPFIFFIFFLHSSSFSFIHLSHLPHLVAQVHQEERPVDGEGRRLPRQRHQHRRLPDVGGHGGQYLRRESHRAPLHGIPFRKQTPVAVAGLRVGDGAGAYQVCHIRTVVYASFKR